MVKLVRIITVLSGIGMAVFLSLVYSAVSLGLHHAPLDGLSALSSEACLRISLKTMIKIPRSVKELARKLGEYMNSTPSRIPLAEFVYYKSTHVCYDKRR